MYFETNVLYDKSLLSSRFLNDYPSKMRQGISKIILNCISTYVLIFLYSRNFQPEFHWIYLKNSKKIMFLACTYAVYPTVKHMLICRNTNEEIFRVPPPTLSNHINKTNTQLQLTNSFCIQIKGIRLIKRTVRNKEYLLIKYITELIRTKI